MMIVAFVAALAAVPVLAEDPYALTVKADHLIGVSRGTLVFEQTGIEYRTSDRDDARTWGYEDIKQLQVLGPKHLRLLTFEDQGRVKFGRDRTFDFEVVSGTVTPELAAFLLTRIDRPIVIAVMPPDCGCAPLAQIPVKHELRHGTDGLLVVHADHLAYLTEHPGDSRYWRWADVASVMRLNPYQLVVNVYEGGSGETRPFVFDLKRDLPDDVYAAMWARVNPATPPFGGSDRRATDTTSP
jgi:hypothetical protein